MRLSLTSREDLAAAMGGLADGTAAAVTRAVRRQVRALTLDLRRRTVAGGLGTKVANAWRDEYFPEQGVSAEAAGRAKSRAPKIIDAFDHAHVIKSPHGRFLSIPQEAARAGDRFLLPAEFERKVGVPLRFVFVRGKRHGWLVADGLRLGKRGVSAIGGGRAFGLPGFAKGRRRGRAVVIVYRLVPGVRTRQRLDLESAAADAQAGLAAALAVEVASVVIPAARSVH